MIVGNELAGKPGGGSVPVQLTCTFRSAVTGIHSDDGRDVRSYELESLGRPVLVFVDPRLNPINYTKPL